MLEKSKTLSRIAESGVVSVVRGSTKQEALEASRACIKGGVKAIELTFVVPGADDIIKELIKEFQDDQEVVIGAGTVLDATTARLAIMAGAKFIVSPSFSKEVAEICNLYAIPYTPGCTTPTEIQEALKSGTELIKVFPGSVVKSGYLSAIHGPFPQVNIMVTGGVSLENMDEWFSRGAVAVGIGGNLTGPAKDGDYAQVEANAVRYAEKLKKIRS